MNMDKELINMNRTAQVVVRADGVRDDEIRIVMIGKTGTGKSATGNTILGVPDYFESSFSSQSTTQKCTRGEKFRFGKKLLVVDTPGLFDTGMDNETVSKEIVKCIGITSPGPHAIILVVQIGRFTEEEKVTIHHFVDIFGEGMYNYLIVLFTRKDDLGGKSIDHFVNDVPEDLKQMLHKCGQRYIAFNNKEPKERDTKGLMDMIENMVKQNGGSCYTNKTYIEAELAMIKRMQLIYQAEQEKKDREIKEIRQEFSKKFQQLIDTEKAERTAFEEKIRRFEKSEKERDIKVKENENDDGKPKRNSVSKIIKQFEENQISQTEDVEDEGDRELKKEKEAKITETECQVDITETTETVKQNLETERQSRIEMEMEQRRRESRIEEKFREETEEESLRGKARDECENENKGFLRSLSNGIKKAKAAFWSFFGKK